jgi:raffinose synthase
LARVSDDFYPTNNASHTVHIANVAYNSVFMGEIVLPDWDMFHSRNEAGELHAAARAVGGCPVYVSDAPGKHDFDLLRQLVFPSGKVLRAELPGRPTRDCLFTDVTRDGVTALKVWNKNKRGGVVGCFNIQGACWSREKGIFVSHAEVPPTVTAAVRLQDVEGILEDYPDSGKEEKKHGAGAGAAGGGGEGGAGGGGGETLFAVQAHRTHRLRLLKLEESIEITLKPKEWEVYTVAPVLRVGAVCWSPIALDQMFNGGGAVIDAGLVANKEGAVKKSEVAGGGAGSVTGSASVYGCGVLVCYSSVKPAAVTVDGFVVKHEWAEADGCLKVWLGTTEGTHEVRVAF